MIGWNPDQRPTATECLKHRFLNPKAGKESNNGSPGKVQFEPFKELTVRKLSKMEQQEKERYGKSLDRAQNH